MPLALVDVTVYVLDPAVVSVMIMGLDAPVFVMPDEDVTVYDVIADPPVAPAVNGTETVLYAVDEAVPIVGAAGTVVAVIELDAAPTFDVPVVFVAVPLNVYAVFDCNPVIVTGDAPVPVNDPGFDVIV